MTATETRQLTQLIETMRQLRSENGCPWDREQTPESLRPYILEEAYELVDAIDNGDENEILSELGDLLLQVVFQAQIYSEMDLFGLGDIAEGINNKLRRRHPRIFSDLINSGQYPDWEQIKLQELKEKGRPTDFVSRLPSNLPALKLADKVCRHLKTEELADERESAPTGLPVPEPESWSEKNLAAALFALVTQAQQRGIDSELALRKHVLNLLPQQAKGKKENADPESSQ